jgi:hypothetical protein
MVRFIAPWINWLRSTYNFQQVKASSTVARNFATVLRCLSQAELHEPDYKNDIGRLSTTQATMRIKELEKRLEDKKGGQ